MQQVLTLRQKKNLEIKCFESVSDLKNQNFNIRNKRGDIWEQYTMQVIKKQHPNWDIFKAVENDKGKDLIAITDLNEQKHYEIKSETTSRYSNRIFILTHTYNFKNKRLENASLNSV